MTLDQLRERFSDETACRTLFEAVIWADGRRCAHCGHEKSYPRCGAALHGRAPMNVRAAKGSFA